MQLILFKDSASRAKYKIKHDKRDLKLLSHNAIWHIKTIFMNIQAGKATKPKCGTGPKEPRKATSCTAKGHKQERERAPFSR